jgi:hypothetical protein
MFGIHRRGYSFPMLLPPLFSVFLLSHFSLASCFLLPASFCLEVNELPEEKDKERKELGMLRIILT